MYEYINDLRSAGLFPVATLLAEEDRSRHEHLLTKIIGVLVTSHERASSLILFRREKLPRPRELTVYENSAVETVLFGKTSMVRVSAYIWRSTIDDTYAFHLSPQRTFYLIIEGLTPCDLLQAEIMQLVNQFSYSKEFPIYLWGQSRLQREILYFLQKNLSCTFFGKGWSVELTYCEDHVVRVTGWTGLATKVSWDTNASFVITTGSPALLFRPTRSKNGFSTTRDVVLSWQKLLSEKENK